MSEDELPFSGWLEAEMIDKQSLRAEYDEYTSEHLLSLRARGDELAHEAHEIIEEIFRARNETIPPRPSRRIVDAGDPAGSQSPILKWGLVIVALVAAQVLIEITKSSPLIGIPVALAGLAFIWWDWQRKRAPTTKERARALAQKRIGSGGFTELMFCAAEGDLSRASELLSYGAKPSVQDDNGASALHYAARAGRPQIVELLLLSGVDRSLKTKTGKTARDYAVAQGHAQIVDMLSG